MTDGDAGCIQRARARFFCAQKGLILARDALILPFCTVARCDTAPLGGDAAGPGGAAEREGKQIDGLRRSGAVVDELPATAEYSEARHAALEEAKTDVETHENSLTDFRTPEVKEMLIGQELAGPGASTRRC